MPHDAGRVPTPVPGQVHVQFCALSSLGTEAVPKAHRLTGWVTEGPDPSALPQDPLATEGAEHCVGAVPLLPAHVQTQFVELLLAIFETVEGVPVVHKAVTPTGAVGVP